MWLILRPSKAINTAQAHAITIERVGVATYVRAGFVGTNSVTLTKLLTYHKAKAFKTIVLSRIADGIKVIHIDTLMESLEKWLIENPDPGD